MYFIWYHSNYYYIPRNMPVGTPKTIQADISLIKKIKNQDT